MGENNFNKKDFFIESTIFFGAWFCLFVADLHHIVVPKTIEGILIIILFVAAGALIKDCVDEIMRRGRLIRQQVKKR